MTRRILCTALLFFSIVAMGDPNQKEIERLFSYIEQGDLGRIALAHKDGISVNLSIKHGETLLMRAAVSKQMSIVKYLVENGADIQAKDKFGFTVLGILESYIQRSGVNEENTVQTMRRQGLSDEAINELLGRNNPGAKKFTENDRIAWQEILNFLKESKIPKK